MKKIILLFAFSMLFSCSKSDSNTSNSSTANTTNYFHPPSWIQGNWGQISSTGVQTKFYSFTTDNVCQISTVSTCWKESIAQAPNIYTGSDVATNSTYDVSLIQNNGAVTTSLKFKKISATKIIWIYSGVDIELYKL